MTNSQETNENESQNSRTINIEIPENCFKGMFKMMSNRSDFSEAASKCCEGFHDTFCIQTGDKDEQEIRIVIKRNSSNQ